jgi:hypothetical protein
MQALLFPFYRIFPLSCVRRDEMDRWRAWMRQHHYLVFERIAGKSLCYVATNNETLWVALLGWGSAALKCAARDQWIGWDRVLQFKRLNLIANNVRFLTLPDLAWCPFALNHITLDLPLIQINGFYRVAGCRLVLKGNYRPYDIQNSICMHQYERQKND